VESRFERTSDAEQKLIDYLLFAHERPLTHTIQNQAQFAETFESLDRPGNSGETLRQLELDRRVFKYPLSFLIYTQPFHSLPKAVHARLGNVIRARLKLDEQSESDRQFRGVLEKTSTLMPDEFQRTLLDRGPSIR